MPVRIKKTRKVSKQKHISSTPRKRTRLSKKARRTQLLDCAVRICADVGISRINHADVAREASVSVAAVFSYFPTRGALVDVILKEVRRYFIDLMMSIPRDPPAKDVLFSMLWKCLQSAQTHPQYLRVWLEWGSAVRDDIWPQYLKVQKESSGILREVLLEGQRDGNIDPELNTEIAARMLADGSRSVASMVFADIDAKAIESMVWNWVNGALQLGLTHAYVAATTKTAGMRRRTPRS